MAYTQAIDETTPAGTEDAKTADDQLRSLKRDIKERLNSFFADYNTDPLKPKAGALFGSHIIVPTDFQILGDSGIVVLFRHNSAENMIHVGWDHNIPLRVAALLTASIPAAALAYQGAIMVNRQTSQLVFFSGGARYAITGTAF